MTTRGRVDPRRLAREIAFEQTVELPSGAFPIELEERVVGRVEEVQRRAPSLYRAVVSYPLAAVERELPQILNLLFGNVSMLSGIRIVGIDWPESLLRTFRGPGHGIEGLRRLAMADRRRPLLCAAIKPVGLSATDLARQCATLALAGVDIVKDDHGLANQQSAPFRERVVRCQEAVLAANRRSGRNCLYFPNLTCGLGELQSRIYLVNSLDIRGVVVSPLLVGLDTVRWIGETTDLVLFSHPALSGVFFQPGHGIAPEILYGQIFRLIGSDGVIFPNTGGRFPVDSQTCNAIQRELRRPLGHLAPAWPVPGGGIDAAKIGHWIDKYGPDTVFLLGSTLHARDDLLLAAEEVVRAVRRRAL